MSASEEHATAVNSALAEASTLAYEAEGNLKDAMEREQKFYLEVLQDK